MMNDANGSKRPLLIELIKATSHDPGNRKLQARLEQEVERVSEYQTDLLDIKPANQWIMLERDKPLPRKLFGDFWLEGELGILFADTNMGKSILAVQLAESIARGKAITGFAMETEAQKVLYIDFELSSQQFETRYRSSRGNYRFSDNFYRAEVNLQAQKSNQYDTYIDFVGYNLHRAIKRTSAQIIVIDNITCLGGSAGQAGPALAMMKQLKLLKTRHQLSILVLAHTPKRRANKPITRDDLGGSKMLMNFADGAFAMAESGTTPGHRYVKQVKQRSAGQTYGQENVCVFKLEKKGSFIGFELVGTAAEYLHLGQRDGTPDDVFKDQVLALKAQGCSQRQIAARLGVGKTKVHTMLQQRTGNL